MLNTPSGRPALSAHATAQRTVPGIAIICSTATGECPRPLAADSGRRADPDTSVLILGCTRRKNATASPVPALDLYQGGVVPPVRARLASRPDLRARVWFLSAEHGLLPADMPVLPYDRRLTPERVGPLREIVRTQFVEAFTGRLPSRALVVAEPGYLALLDGLLAAANIRLAWVPDPRDWHSTAAVLDTWRWP